MLNNNTDLATLPPDATLTVALSDVTAPAARKAPLIGVVEPWLKRAARLEDATVAVHVLNYSPSTEADAFAEAARAARVPCLFFDESDCTESYRLPPYGTVYRTSLVGNRQRVQERVMPPVIRDPLMEVRVGEGPRPYAKRPSIGFCGYISPMWRQAVRRLLGHSEKYIGHRLRRQAIRALSRTDGVEPHLIRRPFYAGGYIACPSDYPAMRQEFIDNLLNSDYTLCVRGAGNFSLRFYETLAAGRIPVLVNTDCPLPFAEQIDWSCHCVTVEESELPSLGDIVARFHAALGAQRFVAMQLANRQLWERWLAPVAFFERLVRSAGIA